MPFREDLNDGRYGRRDQPEDEHRRLALFEHNGPFGTKPSDP